MNIKKSALAHKNLWLILLSAFLFIFAKNWEPGLGVSSTTYGAFAKNILATGNWFHFSLGPGLYDPFVDHPYLVIWLDALAFKVFGVSAQSIRLVSSFFGLFSIATIYGISKELVSEKHAAYSYLILLTITTYFNFIASGWLDIPMISLTLGGFYFAILSEKKNSNLWLLMAGLCLSAAVLTKGIGALGTLPIAGYIFLKNYNRPKALAGFLFGAAAPLTLFSVCHYYHEGFFFWSAYLKRQFGQNSAPLSFTERFEYIKSIWDKGALAIILLPFGIKRLWKDHRDLAIMICMQIMVHIIVYSMSTRQYSQYALPVFPWLAMASGYFLAQKMIRFETTQITKGLVFLALFYFVVIDLIPLRVHAGSDNPYRAFMPVIADFKDTQEILFVGNIDFQEGWEIHGSYISWFYDKIPRMLNEQDLKSSFLGSDKAVAIVSRGFMQDHFTEGMPFICAWNEDLVLLAHPTVCSPELQRYRAIEKKEQIFTR